MQIGFHTDAFNSSYLRLNLDTGNSFIAGRDPVAFCQRGYNGVLSMECEGAGGPMIEKSLAWLRKTLRELNLPVE